MRNLCGWSNLTRSGGVAIIHFVAAENGGNIRTLITE